MFVHEKQEKNGDCRKDRIKLKYICTENGIFVNVSYTASRIRLAKAQFRLFNEYDYIFNLHSHHIN